MFVKCTMGFEYGFLAPVDFNAPLLPVDNPVFQDTTTRVEFELGFTVPAQVCHTWRENFNHQLRCRMQLPVWLTCYGEAFSTYPDHIWCHIIIVSKDHAWCKNCYPTFCLTAPNL